MVPSIFVNSKTGKITKTVAGYLYDTIVNLNEIKNHHCGQGGRRLSTVPMLMDRNALPRSILCQGLKRDGSDAGLGKMNQVGATASRQLVWDLSSI